MHRRVFSAIVLINLACSSFDPNLPTAIAILPYAVTLASVGETSRLSARVTNGQGGEISGATVSWASSISGIATVSGSGLVTAVANGRTEITASVGSLTARATIEVQQLATRISLAPDTVRFASLADTASISVDARDARGNPLQEGLVQWTSSQPLVAVVSGLGLTTSVSNGVATITARAGGSQASATVIVTQVAVSVTVTPAFDSVVSVGDTILLRAVAKDGRGSPVGGAIVTWGSDLPTVATVDQSGRAVSRADGLATITARASAMAAGQAAIRVRQKIAGVRWEPLPGTMIQGQGLAGVRVRIEDGRGSPVTSATGSLGLTLTPGSAAGVLAGAANLTASGGFVELTPATISLPGVNYRLTAVWSGFPSITTPLFTIQHHFVSLKSGGAYACARDDAAATWCWGDNSSQQMLLSGVTEATFPTRAPALDRFTPLLLGSAAACGVDAGQLFCWANIDYPVLTTPIAIPGGTGLSLYSMDAGENFGCGLKAGSPVCWGVFFNPGSAIGVQPLPGPVGIVYTFLGTASSHSCAISSVNAAYCQGNNPEGQIGDGSIAFRTSLTPVAGGHQFVAIDGGINHTCAITTTGGLYCWGDNRAGELGDLSLGPNSKIPIQVATPVPLTTVHVGFAHGCGVGTDRRAYCWGHGGNGAIGTGADHASNPTVQQVGLPDPVAMVQVGAFHSCALTIRGQVLCWGFNFNGQRGDGGVGDIWLPSPVGVKP